jgi:hypothetical protein
MLDSTSEVTQENVEQPAQKSTIGEIVPWLKDNFVLVSAAALLVGLAFATTLLTSYLSVFDWHLIWFVQYPDVITFGVLGAAIISTSVIIVQNGAHAILSAQNPKQKRNVIIVMATTVALMLAVGVWFSFRAREGSAHLFEGMLAIVMAVAVIVAVASYFEKRQLPTAAQAISILSLLLLGTGALGRWLGDTVKETASFNQDITIKDQVLNNAKIVIVMSRHTILLKDDVLYAVPTGDITKFRTADRKVDGHVSTAYEPEGSWRQ